MVNATCYDDRPGSKSAFPKTESIQSMSLLQLRQVSFPGGSYHMDTCSKLGEVWGKFPVADETYNFLWLSIFFSLSRIKAAKDLICIQGYIFFTPPSS